MCDNSDKPSRSNIDPKDQNQKDWSRWIHLASNEAIQIALKFTVPVIILSDGTIANGAEPWHIPNSESLPEIKVEYASDPKTYKVYMRDNDLMARKLALPGTPGFEHRIGGLEKDEDGNVSYDPDNHNAMVDFRAEKIKRIRNFVIDPEIVGPAQGELLLISWGSSYGPMFTALENLKKEGIEVSWIHLRWLNPLPVSLENILRNFHKVMVFEINKGQLIKILRSEYLVDADAFNRVSGLPFKSLDIVNAVRERLGKK